MIKTYANKEKRRVVAVADGCAFDAINRIIKHHPYIDEFDVFDDEDNFNYGFENALMDDKYTAVAKCHEDDVFDEEIGKKIAKDRLIEKLNAASDKAVKRWIKHQAKIMEVI